MKQIDPTWNAGALLICKKCSGNDQGDLRKRLKKALKARGLLDRVKLVKTGCLDICPKNQVTTVLAPSHEPSRVLVVDPSKDVDALVDEVARWLNGSESVSTH